MCPLVIVLQSDTIIDRPALVSLPMLGCQVEQEVMKACALDVALAHLLCGLRPISGNEDNGHFSVLLWEDKIGLVHERTKLSPSVWLWKALMMLETLEQEGGKTLRLICVSFPGWHSPQLSFKPQSSHLSQVLVRL